MSNVNTEGLPPEMQQRIADIIEKAKANQIQPQQQQAPQQPQYQPQQMAANVAPPPAGLDEDIPFFPVDSRF